MAIEMCKLPCGLNDALPRPFLIQQLVQIWFSNWSRSGKNFIGVRGSAGDDFRPGCSAGRDADEPLIPVEDLQTGKKPQSGNRLDHSRRRQPRHCSDQLSGNIPPPESPRTSHWGHSRRNRDRIRWVFAPTDEAFAKLPAGTLDSLLKPENKAKLQSILTYHVVSGKVMAADVVKLNSAKTVEGERITIKTVNAGVMVNQANVTKPDIEASNGIIHVIDAVLLPK